LKNLILIYLFDVNVYIIIDVKSIIFNQDVKHSNKIIIYYSICIKFLTCYAEDCVKIALIFIVLKIRWGIYFYYKRNLFIYLFILFMLFKSKRYSIVFESKYNV